MTGNTSDRRRWPGRRRAFVSMAAIGLLAAACGGGGSPAASASPFGPAAMTAEALAYAKCMRSHGITNFPDPSGQGRGPMFPTANIDPHTPQYQSADKTCQQKTGFGHFSAAQLQEGMAGMLKYAECMRSHGIPNFPDPFGNSQQIGFNLTGTGIDMRSPRFKAASKTCQPLMPGGGP